MGAMPYGSDSAIFDDLPVLCFFWRLVTYDLKKKESDYF